MLESDLKLWLGGFSPTWAVDYSELFRYMHVILDFLRTKDKASYFTKQFAVRMFMQDASKAKIIFSQSIDEYRGSLINLEETVRRLINEIDWEDLMPEPKKYEKVFQKFAKEFDNLIPVEQLEGNWLEQMVISATKAELIRIEFNRGVGILQQLVSNGTIGRINPEFESTINARPDFIALKDELTSVINKLPLSSKANIPTYGALIAKLTLINRHYSGQNKLFVMVTDSTFWRTNDIKELRMEVNSPDIKVAYPNGFPMLRSLNYLMLDAFASFKYRNIDKRLAFVSEIRKLVSDAIPLLYGADSNVITKRRAHSELDSLMKNLSELHAWDAICQQTSLHIQGALDVDQKEFLALSTKQILERFSAVVSDPTKVYAQYVSLESQLASVRRWLDQELKQMGTGDVKERDTAFGLYPIKALMPEDGPIRTELIALFDRMLQQMTGDKELHALLDEIKRLQSICDGSPAIYVAEAICLRWLGQFDQSAKCIDKAISLKPINLEANFQRAVLYRTVADSPSTPESERGSWLLKALDFGYANLPADKQNPRICQFLAYVNWRILEHMNPVLHLGISEAERKRIDECVRLCKLGLKADFPTDSRKAARIKWMLVRDIAYYYSLTGERDNIVMAREQIDKVPIEFLDAPGYDTKGYVYLSLSRFIEKKDVLSILLFSFKYYSESIRLGSEQRCTKDGVSESIRRYFEAGGNPSDLLKK
ncbi:hypothetical protein TRIP_C50008 [Candidatus Zixiibacteriota bacterium]|nr:hypothetical protein TRIP_C50008 [candidate division Zixibacteria bacterium]